MVAPDASHVSQPSRVYLRIIRTIDRITEWTGYAFALLVVPLVLANTIEVFSRYVLGSPTAWARPTCPPGSPRRQRTTDS